MVAPKQLCVQEEAEDAVKQAQADYKKAIQALAAADGTAAVAGNTSGRKRLHRKPSTASHDAIDAEDEDDDLEYSPPKKRVASAGATADKGKAPAAAKRKSAPPPNLPVGPDDVIDLVTTDEERWAPRPASHNNELVA